MARLHASRGEDDPLLALAIEPELRLAAAVIKCAVADARGFGAYAEAARHWLTSETARGWFDLITPADRDVDAIQRAALALASSR